MFAAAVVSVGAASDNDGSFSFSFSAPYDDDGTFVNNASNLFQNGAFNDTPNNTIVKKSTGTKQVFRKNFFLVLDGIPDDWCMRASDLFCLNQVTKSILNKKLKKAAWAEQDSQVNFLTLKEIMCGHNFVIFPRPDSQMWQEEFEFDGPPNDDDNNNNDDDDNGAMLGRARPEWWGSRWSRDRYVDNVYFRDLGRLSWSHKHKKKAKKRDPRASEEMLASSKASSLLSKLWYGGAEMMGECANEGCHNLWSMVGNNKMDDNGTMIQATDVQDALCAKLSNKCGSYFNTIKHCRIIFGGKRMRFPDSN